MGNRQRTVDDPNRINDDELAVIQRYLRDNPDTWNVTELQTQVLDIRHPRRALVNALHRFARPDIIERHGSRDGLEGQEQGAAALGDGMATAGHKMYGRYPWTSRRDGILREHWGEYAPNDPAWGELLGEEPSAGNVAYRAKKLGLPNYRTAKKRLGENGTEQGGASPDDGWTAEEDALIRELWPDIGVNEEQWRGVFSNPAHSTVMDVWKRARQLGVPDPEPHAGRDGGTALGEENGNVPDSRLADPMFVGRLLNRLKTHVVSLHASVDFGDGVKVECD